MPLLGEQLAWRPVPVHAVPCTTGNHSTDATYPTSSEATPALLFDLSLPLKPLLDAAKNYLVTQQRRLTRQEHGLSYRVADHAHRWGLCLRALDADFAQAQPAEVAALLFPGSTDAEPTLSALMAEGNRLRAGDHRRILLLSD